MNATPTDLPDSTHLLSTERSAGDATRIPSSPPVIVPVQQGKEGYLWSVMIPSYNCTQYLATTITSVLQQDTGTNMQIEVIDDYSTDGDVETVVKEVGKGRVGYYRQPRNVGSLRNFETCINRAKGKWVHILHGDDLVHSGFYNEIETLFKLDEHIGAAFVNNSTIDAGGKVKSVHPNILPAPGIIPDFLYQIAKYQRLEPPAIVVKRSVYEKLGSFYAVHYGEDWEMWTRIAANYKVAYSPKILASYRALKVGNISSISISTGQNLTDLLKVIDLIQPLLPPDKRDAIKRYSIRHYAIYSIKLAHGLIGHNNKAAILQVKAAWRLDRSAKSFYWLSKFFAKYLMASVVPGNTTKVKTKPA
ncbi:glycosyltransferase [Segetibacter sp. 3557_3]|uniref:glycosyltransferase family 2 protein n=1 Tax=Segetibacter sp. 3557_3 TaxID=2547429 RepID=UPI0010584F0E|nr:glycosyltransferase [Segetibacter sp. 3557_3]TDH20821.1 glycosyltransferase [Segetibacter sp. 3557_3]